MNDKLKIIKNNNSDKPLIRKDRILNTEPINNSSIDLISKKVILAHFNSPLIQDLPETIIRAKIIMKAVNRAIADTSCSGLDASYMHEHVANDVIEHFGHLTVEEIELAFHLGARKKLGEYYGLSVVAFFEFLEKYAFLKHKAFDEWKKYSEQQLKQEARDKELLEIARKKAENQKFVKDSIATLQNYIDGNIKEHKVKDLGNMIYNSLVKLKIIVTSEEEEKEYYEKAKKRQESKNKSGTLGGALAFLNIVPIAKKLALHDFIEKCKKDKTNLQNLFNKAINGIEKK